MEFVDSDGSILVISDDKAQPKFLTDFLPKNKKSKKDRSWDTHKTYSNLVATDLKSSKDKSHRKYAERIAECAQRLEFGWVLSVTETGEYKLRLKLAWFCRTRFCPVCQWRRALMWVSRFFDAFPRIYEEYSEMRYIMLTLTVRNCEISELRKVVKQMNAGWQRITQRKAYPALGFVRSLEVTPEKDLYKNSKGDSSSTPKKGYSLIRKARPDYCHPHFHILLAVPPSYFSGGSRGSYLSKDDWAELLKHAMRLDYKPVVDVRIVKPRKGSEPIQVEGVNLPESMPDATKSLMSAITETIKYTTKPSDMVKEKSWLFEMVNQMHNVRAVSLGGIFKQFLKETDDDNQDLITATETDIDKAVKNEGGLIFDYRKQYKKYAYLGKRKQSEKPAFSFELSRFRFKKPVHKLISHFCVLPVLAQKVAIRANFVSIVIPF